MLVEAPLYGLDWVIAFLLLRYSVNKIRKRSCREHGHQWIELKEGKLKCSRCKAKQKNISVLKKARV